MGRETTIAWADHTFNGVRGCEHATLADGTESPGCKHCYAETMSKRNPAVLGMWPHRAPEGSCCDGAAEGTRVLGKPGYWANLDKWHRAAVADGEMRRVFCYSLGDVFESPRSLANADVCAKGRALLFEAIERLRPWPPSDDDDWNTATAQNFAAKYGHAPKPRGLIFLLLTKRPENMRRMVPASWLVTGAPEGSRLGWPRHVWLGTSVENQQAADERIPHLLDVPGVPVRFLSIEPLLERIDVRMYLAKHGALRPSRIGWGIAGGESGHRARPCDLAWTRDLRDQFRAAGVPFFNKQLGAKPITQYPPRFRLQHPKGEDPAEWPEDLRVREVPEVRL
jgi:protein gp37